MNKICDTDSSLTKQNEICLFYTHLFGKENMNDSENLRTVEFILLTEKYNVPLFE